MAERVARFVSHLTNRDALPVVRCAVGGCSKVTDNGPLAGP